MANELEGKKIAIIATDGVEQVELEEPRKAVEDAGAETELISLEEGEIQAMNGDINKGDTFEVDQVIGDADVERLRRPDPARWRRNPDNLRQDERRHQVPPGLLRRRASRSARSATRRGRWSRPISSRAGHSRRIRRSAPTSATRAARSWTRRSWSTRGW